MLGTRTVVLLRAPVAEDAYGSETRDWDNATRTTVEGCSVQPARSSEYTVDREAVIVRLRAFCPGTPLLPDPDEPGVSSPVQSTDRAEVAGEVFTIDGVEPWPEEPLAHTDLLLQKVTG